MPATEREGQTKHIEREYEVGKDESWFANVKRLHDEMLHESLESMRRGREQYDRSVSEAQSLTSQMLQNAITNSNTIAQANAINADALTKQLIRHNDLSVDRQWNIDEVAHLVAKTPVFLDAISAAVAAAVAGSIAPKGD